MVEVISATNLVQRGDICGVDMDIELATKPGEYIPFHATPDDCEEFGRNLYERAVSGEFGPIRRIYVNHRTEAEQSARMMLSDATGLATSRIAPLQDAKELGLATPEELTRLEALQRYRIALMRLPESEGWPTAVTWPELPQ